MKMAKKKMIAAVKRNLVKLTRMEIMEHMHISKQPTQEIMRRQMSGRSSSRKNFREWISIWIRYH
jgi:RNase P protein component